MPQKGVIMANKDRLKLDDEDRMIIQACLHDHKNITEISQRLGKNKSTISRELHRNQIIKLGNNVPCNDLKQLVVCNVCKKKKYCVRTKIYYDFQKANEWTHNRRRISRSTPKLREEYIKIIDKIVTDGVLLGQSLHHIYMSDSTLQSICSERTIRRLIYRGNLSIRPHQLRRYVRFKHRLPKSPEEVTVRDIRMLIGRTFKEFNHYVSTHKRANIVEFDSVIGKSTDKQCLLTITFPKMNFQFGLLIDKGSASSCNHQLRSLFRHLGTEITKEIFPINLCDNGLEFSRFYQLEFNQVGERVHRCFYTNPYKATDKPHCERNHELVRYVLPKGRSLDSLTQEMVNDLFSNLNSYVRKSKKNRTPYDLVKTKYGKEFLDTIHIRRIPNKKVKLIPIV